MKVCGIRKAIQMAHDAMDMTAWTAFLSKERPNAVPLKTLFVNSKEKTRLLYTVPATQRADMKELSRAAGVKPSSLRVGSAQDIQSAFFTAENAVFSLLHLTHAEEADLPKLTEVCTTGFRCCFDASILTAKSDAEFVLLHPTPGQGSVVVELDCLLEGLKQFFPTEFISVASSGTDQAPHSTTTPTPTTASTHATAESTSSSSTNAPSSGTGLVMKHTKEGNFQEWYAEVITKAELLEYYDVSGCYILRPWSYHMWECIKKFLDGHFDLDGVENCYFPMFISKGALEKEKSHIEGFAPEVAWVTKSGESDLTEPIAIRPTSETVMYPSFAKWIRSHRDLPLRLNQWCNVVRWEFSHPMPFIRTREFLWQEGHTAWCSLKDATAEVHWSLDLYRRVYEELLAVPVIPGKKTEKEKFAGALFTTTVETFIPASGRGCQGATSHCLGQSFSKMFQIEFEDENKQKQLVWQNSWGMTTRTIGVMVMVHGDDKGLVLPPPVAFYQVVIVPCGIQAKTTEEEKNQIMDACSALAKTLKSGGLRAHADLRMHQSPGWRYNYWEQRGVPVRIEFGPKELHSNQYVVCRRDTGEKTPLLKENVVDNLKALLEKVYQDMFAKAKTARDAKLVKVVDWKEFVPTLNRKCVLLAPWCEKTACEEEIKKVSGDESKKGAQEATAEEDARAPSMGAKTLCIPFDQPKEDVTVHKCIAPSCKESAKTFVLFGRSY